jgi:Cap4 SAVED domain
MKIVYPDPFLEIRFNDLAEPFPTTGLCAGYEGGVWRSARLADHLFQWLPYAALNQEHQLGFASHNFVEMLRIAAAHIYNTKKTSTRGEIGELLLHLACVLHMGTVPVMCKLVLKSSSNDTVKGFDGIHILLKGPDFELWLGESKFYVDPQEAIRDAVASVQTHIVPAFLTTEKAMIFGHVGPDIPHRDTVLKLFTSQTSGDLLLQKSVFPILIAYESPSVASFNSISQKYISTLASELVVLRSYFGEKGKNLKLRFHLLFVPLRKKQDVVDHFDKLLEAFL